MTTITAVGVRARPGVLPAAVPAGLLLIGVPLLRPGVFGEVAAPAGLALALAAGVAALVRRERVRPFPVPAVTALAGLLCLASLYLVVRGVLVGPAQRTRSEFQDFALTMGTVLAAALALADPGTRRALGRGFVLLLAGIGLSWLVTAAVWSVAGVGVGEIGSVVVGNAGAQPVYFPFTISYSTSAVFGVDVPRLAGVGRESGWMAMFCGAGWFLADAVGYRSVAIKALLVAGLVGTLSTAGFGVFVVVLAVDVFLRPRGPIGLRGMVRQLAGLAAIGGAMWLAVAAPVLGLSAKQSSNEASVQERSDATAAGLRALLSGHPWGGLGTETQAGVNLVSDIAVSGIVFVVLVAATLLVPPLLAGRTGPHRGAAVALVVFLTLLTSQPAAASTWAFLVVAVALACDALTETEREAPGSPALAPIHRRLAGARRKGRPA